MKGNAEALIPLSEVDKTNSGFDAIEKRLMQKLKRTKFNGPFIVYGNNYFIAYDRLFKDFKVHCAGNVDVQPKLGYWQYKSEAERFIKRNKTDLTLWFRNQQEYEKQNNPMEV